MEVTMNIPEEKIGWVGLIEENVDVNETLRIHIHGILSRKKDGPNSVILEFPEKLKLRSGSKITRMEYKKMRFIGILDTLPKWKTIHKGEETIYVDFEAEITDYNGTDFTVRLPDSYTDTST